MHLPIQVKYTFDIAQFLRANRSARRQQISPIIKAAAIIVGLGAVLTGAVCATNGDLKNGLPLIGIPLYLWLMLFVRSFVAKRRFNRSPGKDAAIEWSFSEDEIRVTSSAGSSTEFRWSLVDSIVQCPDGLLISTHPRLFHWIPKEAISPPNEFSDLCDLTRAKAKKFKKL